MNFDFKNNDEDYAEYKFHEKYRPYSNRAPKKEPTARRQTIYLICIFALMILYCILEH